MPDLSPSPLDGLTLGHLKMALAAISEGSQEAGARMARVSQATMSRALNLLRTTLGFPIFEPSGVPTPSALRILPLLEKITVLGGRAARLLKPMNIQVSITRSFAGAMSQVHALLKPHTEKGAHLVFASGTSDQIMRAVNDGTCDIGLILHEALKNYPVGGIFNSSVKIERPTRAFVRNGHPLSTKGTFSRPDLVRSVKPRGVTTPVRTPFPLIWFQPHLSPMLHAEIDESLKAGQSGLTFNPTHFASDLETICAILGGTDAVGFFPDVFALYQFPQFVSLKPEFEMPLWKFTVIRHSSNEDERIVKLFGEIDLFCREKLASAN